MYSINNFFHTFTLPPILFVTLFFILGIANHTFLHTFFIFFLISLCATTYFFSQNRIFRKNLILYPLFLLLGAFLHQKKLSDYDNFYASINNQKLTITGVIIDKNETTLRHQKTNVITIKINEIATQNYTLTCNKTMLLYKKCNIPAETGDTIQIFDILLKKPSSESFQLYQIKEDIIATFFDNSLDYTIVHHPTWSWRYWIWRQKQRLLLSLSQKFSPQTFQFFSSLFLGNRMCIKESLEETNEQFKTWGISHFLARSGLHLSLFIFILQTIFCVIPLPLFFKRLCILFLSSIYFLLTWPATPFIRSFALFLFGQVCIAINISFQLMHYVTLICFCFLLYNPLYLFFLDFQLTFALTFALAWLNQACQMHEHDN